MNYREPGGKTARCWRCPFLYGGPPSFDNDVCMHPEWHGTIVVDDRPHDECLSARESVAKRWTHGDGPDAWCMTWLGEEPQAIAHGVTAEEAQRIALDLAAADLLAMIRDVDTLRGKR